MRHNCGVEAVELCDFIRDLGDYVPELNAAETLEFVAPRMHYVSLDSNAFLPCCLDWRAEIRLGVMESHVGDPDVVVGHVDFLVLQLGHEPADLVLAEFSEEARRFADLFDGSWLASDVEEEGCFAAAASIDVVMIVLDVVVDESARGHQLGAWAVSEAVGTMLPTSAGLAVMFPHWDAEFDGDISMGKVEAVERLNRYWQRVGLVPVDGHPGFLGQATAFTYLDDARRDLAAVRESAFHVPVDSLRMRLANGDGFSMHP